MFSSLKSSGTLLGTLPFKFDSTHFQLGKTRGRGRGRGRSLSFFFFFLFFFFFFQHHRSSLVTTLDAVPYSGGHWFRELTTFYSSKKRNEAKNTRYETIYFLERKRTLPKSNFQLDSPADVQDFVRSCFVCLTTEPCSSAHDRFKPNMCALFECEAMEKNLKQSRQFLALLNKILFLSWNH